MIPKYEIKAISTNDCYPFADDIQLTDSTTAAQILRQLIGSDLVICESFVCIFLNRANRPVGWAKISTGGISATTVDPRIVAKYAIDTLSSAVILAHNHPSGNIRPSEGDKQITKTLKSALILFDIKVLDHLIITEKSHFSFADDCML
jgi:DNA repair protein RadC